MGESILVLGAGVAGASAAYWLARDGHEVMLLEAGAAVAAHSSSRSAGILRAAVDDPVTRALALEQEELLLTGELPDHAARALFAPVGLVVFEGASVDAPAAAWAHDLRSRGVAEPLDYGDLARIAPSFRPRGARAWLLSGGGRVSASGLVKALLRAAVKRGAELRTNAPVARVVVEDSRVAGVDLANGERLRAERVVLAAGAWSGALGESAGAHVPLTSTRRHIVLANGAAGDSAPLAATSPILWDDAAGFYARHHVHGVMLCPCDQGPMSPDDEARRYVADGSQVARTLELAREHLATGSTLRVERAWCGLRDLTPDDRPVVGPDPRVAGLAWLAGLGGHGFSVGVAAGRVLADRIAGRPDGLPAEVGPDRDFGARGALHQETAGA